MEALRRRRAEILGVARKRRAHRIAVFGSVARGEARPESDLDLLVDFEPGASLLDHVGLFQDLEELLGVGVDVVTRNALKPRDDHIRAGLGKKRWDTERPLRLAGEAVIGRLGDIATKLPDEVIEATPEIPWQQVKGMRIIVAHAYHRIDYEEVWVTLRDDVPRMDEAIKRWRQTQE